MMWDCLSWIQLAPVCCRRILRNGEPILESEAALFSDALGEPGSPGGTYPGMIRHNVNVIVEALK